MFRKKDDILLKSAFDEAFPDLLRFYFPNADTIFDMGRGFEFLDKELSELFPELEKQGGTRFVDMLIYIENPEINRNFDREIEVLTGKENAMGIIEAIKKITKEEGREEGFISTAENLLKRGVSVREVSEITTLTSDEVNAIAKKLRK